MTTELTRWLESVNIPSMKRYLASIGIALLVGGAIGAVVTIDSHDSPRTESKAVSGHSVSHSQKNRKASVVKLPPVTTTTVPTTTPTPVVTQTTAPTPKATPVTSQSVRTVTGSAPASTSEGTTSPVTTPTTVPAPTGPIATSMTVTVTGGATAPDGSSCEASYLYGCFLVTAHMVGDGNASSPPVGTLTYTLYSDKGVVLGMFTPKVNGQTYCLFSWYGGLSSASATSPDCNGSASSSVYTTGFHYSASFTEVGYEPSSSGELGG